MRLTMLIVLSLLSGIASAASYTSPSGYLQIIGYKLQLTQRAGKAELAVSGRVEALADCAGAALLFDVLDRAGGTVGTFKIVHGAFYRHDVWELGPGEFTPVGADAAGAVAAADHVAIRAADCTPRP